MAWRARKFRPMALEPFDGVIANVFNGIQVKYLKSSPIMRIRWLIRLIFLLDF
jgi:hypothetical protein